MTSCLLFVELPSFPREFVYKHHMHRKKHRFVGSSWNVCLFFTEFIIVKKKNVLSLNTCNIAFIHVQKVNMFHGPSSEKPLPSVPRLKKREQAEAKAACWRRLVRFLFIVAPKKSATFESQEICFWNKKQPRSLTLLQNISKTSKSYCYVNAKLQGLF